MSADKHTFDIDEFVKKFNFKRGRGLHKTEKICMWSTGQKSLGMSALVPVVCALLNKVTKGIAKLCITKQK